MKNGSITEMKTTPSVNELSKIDGITVGIVGLITQKKRASTFLRQVCELIYSKTSGFVSSVLIEYNHEEYKSKRFIQSSTLLNQFFKTKDDRTGFVEIDFDSTLLVIESSECYLSVQKQLPVWSVIIVGALSDYRLHELSKDCQESQKELHGLERANEILSSGMSIFNALQEICEYLPEAWQHPLHTVVRIFYDDEIFIGRRFKESNWMQRQDFETPEKKRGSIEVFYLKKFPEADEGPFLKEERSFLNNLAALISGVATKNALEELLKQNTERLKELKGINATSEILKSSRKIEEALPQICVILPASFLHPENTVVRIRYDKKQYVSDGFRETTLKIFQPFQSVMNRRGTIEVFYTGISPDDNQSPFLSEERDLLSNLASLIAGKAAKDVFVKIQRLNRERLKELSAINQTSRIIEEGNDVTETLQKICDILPLSWQYSNDAACRIRFEGHVYVTSNFEETHWCLSEQIVTIDNKKGCIEIFYLQKFPDEDKGPFLIEEQNLLVNIGKLVSGFLNRYKGFEIINHKGVITTNHHRSYEFRESLVRNKKPLQLYFNQQSIEKYVYLDMMKYKVKHILFIATLYDAFMLESEDAFFEKFMGEIYQYGLFSLPRITGVSSAQEALDLLETTHFDMVLMMVGLDKEGPIELSEKIKEQVDSIPIYLLLNKKSDIKYFEDLVPTIRSVDQLFVWNGDSIIIFAIVKAIEDRINVQNDTQIGLVRVILLIEDSPLYYSKYLQMLYSIVFDQVKEILPEVEKNELDKICRMRSRPKILLARNYEEGIAIFNRYKDFLLCVISDVEFERKGVLDKHAGIKFINHVKSGIHNIPVVLQSSDEKNLEIAKHLNVSFLNKNSKTLIDDLRGFLKNYMGFGNFIFRDEMGNKIAVAKSLRAFETLLKTVPDKSFYIHAKENQFSLWLMARGEIQLAKTLNPISVSSFEKVNQSRQFFIDAIYKYKEEKKKGRIMNFDETAILDEKNIVSFCKGSLGGKGRGLAFINVLIYNLDFSELASRINILTPITVIIETDEFEHFISRNNLHDKIFDPEVSYAQLRTYFFESKLSNSLMRKLKVFVSQIDRPIAVRSSSTSEDSITQPFSGVFDTYILPNSKTNKKKILELVSNAIKLIYASVYSDDARIYFTAINHRIEDEKMAIILQELVGSYHDDYYYPHISGVAQSYNYYPVAKMKAEEGFAVSAIGLGSYVVNGWKAYRFSPQYPKVSICGIKDLLNSTQVKFYALNCRNLDIDLLENGELAGLELLDIEVAEKHKTLNHCVSVYSADNDRIEAGLSSPGPRVVNFADILQYDYIPLAKTLKMILQSVEEAFGSPVEIEYAVDLTRTKNNLPTFYLLQIKPMVTDFSMQKIDLEKVETSKMMLFTHSSLGNGKIDDVSDIIYADPQCFSKLETLEMVKEIESMNREMVKQNKKYILIGPGRWGTRDQFLGIPVIWSQISNAKVIVETSMVNFPLDSSLGSHFFHNVTSMNIGYFSVLHNSRTDFIQWDQLIVQKVVSRTKHFVHVNFDQPLQVIMDGKKKTSAILF